MGEIKTDKYVLKKFGVSLGIVLLLATFFISRKSPQNIWPIFSASALLYILAFARPTLLRPLHVVFMRFGFFITWIISRLALLIIFYFLFTPLGIIMRLFASDPLDRKIDKRKVSYWREKEKTTPGPSGYEKQF